MAFFLLILAIVAEVVATSALKASEGFTRPLASLTVVVGYGLAFYLLSLVLRELPVGIAYAIWAGLGIVLVTLVGAFAFDQKPDLPALLGIGLIVAGVVTLQVFSNMNVH
ncbi:DMT family transporter [Halomonas sp. HNIBRBA4712]|uniref:DMT family transporter n=1 Tax=Halomonas sp. HNIBRBA4712 TaxID=3373087 RepID=UPI003746CE1C